MSFKDIFDRKKQVLNNNTTVRPRIDIPENMWLKCGGCKKTVYSKDVLAGDKTCPVCGYLFRMTAAERIKLVIDEGTFEPFENEIPYANPLDFPDYEKKLQSVAAASGLKEAVVSGRGKIHGLDTVICVMDSQFMMGSMGYAVGEIITRAIEKATELSLPIIIFTASGGARMQEGMVSLMQMAKVSGALASHSDAGNLYVTVLTDPTTGGVTASFAMLGDIILAERGALIGFAGKRVIEQTIKQKLPQGFQSAEFLLEKGFVDMIIDRKNCKQILWKILLLHQKEVS